jgi:hypothetical protein
MRCRRGVVLAVAVLLVVSPLFLGLHASEPVDATAAGDDEAIASADPWGRGVAASTGPPDRNAPASTGGAGDSRVTEQGAAAQVTRVSGTSLEGHDLTLHVQMQADGDARWTVTTFVPLEDENDTEAFEKQREQWRAGELDAGPDADLFRGFVRSAREATGREMQIADVSRSAATVANGSRGAFRLSFTWTNFGRVQGHRVVVNDSFQSPSGTWLDGLEEGWRLVIRSPSGYSPESIPPGARLEGGSRIIWTGPTTFRASYFLDQPVVFMADGRTPTVTATDTTTASASPSPGEPSSNGSMGLWLGIVAAVLLGGGLALTRLLDDDRLPGGAPAGASGPDDGDGGHGGGAATAAADPADVDEADDDPVDEAAPAAASEPDPADPFAGVDQELLSDEEQVLRLLDANGGRMKQATIVKETGWSNAKVSQLLSSMDEDDDIDKLRIGRENLISLPDVDVGEVE